MHQYAITDTSMLRIPSRMKIHDHAAFPPTPDISAIPRARIPPKAPARVAAEKKRAIRKPHSCRIYLKRVSISSSSNNLLLGIRGLPLRDVIIHTRKQPTLKHPQENSRSHKPRIVLDKPLTYHSHAPEEHDKRQPYRWPCPLHHDVRWYLSGDVKGKKHSETIIVLQAVEFEILLEMIEACVADVSAVQETQAEKKLSASAARWIGYEVEWEWE
jgi:hypothetical protein